MLPTERGDVSQEIVGNRRALSAQLPDGPVEIDRVPVDDGGGDELRPATMWVAALIFALALSVLSSPRPDAPPPALLAPT